LIKISNVEIIPIKKLNFSSALHHNHVFKLVVLAAKPKAYIKLNWWSSSPEKK